MLFGARGKTALLSSPSIAVVGACKALINAVRLAQKLLEQLAAKGYVVVSGLARGIDTAAHNGALARGTVAVIAGGIDIINICQRTPTCMTPLPIWPATLAEIPPAHTANTASFPYSQPYHRQPCARRSGDRGRAAVRDAYYGA